jgi:hypothetical protein
MALRLREQILHALLAALPQHLMNWTRMILLANSFNSSVGATMKNSADSGCIFTYRSYGAKWLFGLVSINMTPLTGLESAKLSQEA